MNRLLSLLSPVLAACLLSFPASAQCWPEVSFANSTADDLYGRDVALLGDLMAVGAEGDSQGGTNAGAVFIHDRNMGGTGNWGLELKLIAPDPDDFDWFGRAVALEGNLLFVGAYGDDDSGGTSGSVYIFDRNLGGSSAWGFVKKIGASDGAAGDQFGIDVAASGNRLVVGAFGNDDGGSTSGSAYVFERNQGGSNNWGQVKKLTASDGQALDWFGRKVDIDGNTVVVGAAGNDDLGSSSGSAYVFERNQGGSNNWGQVKKLLASNGGNTHQYGYSVAVVADTIVVGAQQDTSPLAGQLYVYERDLGGSDNWGESAILEASDGGTFDSLGSALAFTGDMIAAGAWRDDDNGSDSGSAYVFERNLGGLNNWGQAQKFSASDGAQEDRFGRGIAADGGEVVVGAPGDDNNGNESGSVYHYSAPAGDCNCNGIADTIEISSGAATDLNGNGVLDECEIIQSDYCFCAASGPVPCGNPDGSAGCMNSTGSGAYLSAVGTGSLANDDLTLSMSPLAPNPFGIFFTGESVIGPFVFGDGLRCAGGQVYRYNLTSSGASGVITRSNVLGYSAANFGAGQLISGSTWNFQGWYRDASGPCASSFNLTQAKSITFSP